MTRAGERCGHSFRPDNDEVPSSSLGMRTKRIICFHVHMNEQLESLKKYVVENRARGVSDEAITQELTGKGWKVSDVEAVIGGSNEPIVAPTGWMENARTMHLILGGGAVSSVAAIATFAVKLGSNIFAPLCVIADAFNLLIAYSIWKKTFFASGSIWYRIFIGFLLIPATVFAIGSTLFFMATTLQSIGVNILFGETLEEAEIILFLLGLPVQVIVYFLSSITVGILHGKRKKAGLGGSLRSVLRGHVYFMVLAGLATAALFLGFHL